MLISELAKDVHDNAVEHGWWDEEREAPEIIALVHSEWSEALEEARAGRPMVWYACADCADGPCEVDHNSATACGFKRDGRKPEGIAVELIDGCIRILDYIGKLSEGIGDLEVEIKAIGCDEISLEIESFYTDHMAAIVYDDLPRLIAYLHMHTSAVMQVKEECTSAHILALLMPFMLAMSWVKRQGIDPLALLLEKHEYNKSRPYKHGKKF